MGKWSAKISERVPENEPSKPSKRAFDGFVGSLPDARQEIQAKNLDWFRRRENLPDKPCLACGGGRYWLADDGWRCIRCRPPSPVKPEDLAGAVADWVNRDTIVCRAKTLLKQEDYRR